MAPSLLLLSRQIEPNYCSPRAPSHSQPSSHRLLLCSLARAVSGSPPRHPSSSSSSSLSLSRARGACPAGETEMIACRCLKILALVSLAALALRASSLLLGRVAPPCPSSSEAPSRRPGQLQPTDGGGVAVAGGVVSASPGYRRHRRRMEGGLAAFAARRFRQHHVVAGAGAAAFEADKRLAPTGSNPLHNRR
ncbi:uncharacterized protein LOC107304662 [Oryza brachyantha]|uniref:uncharacterized protein LOC107304662 n=1 Tax=Oryza brachyantha TaxID=4533 RepID=UPI001ADB42C8|nr:uncharacterized protein LOC107304662 [Oryza brachyantha]